MSKDTNVYSSSAFMHLLRSKYGLDKLMLSSLLKMTIRDIDEIVKGKKQLGREKYELILDKYPRVELCDYDGRYKPKEKR